MATYINFFPNTLHGTRKIEVYADKPSTPITTYIGDFLNCAYTGQATSIEIDGNTKTTLGDNSIIEAAIIYYQIPDRDAFLNLVKEIQDAMDKLEIIYITTPWKNGIITYEYKVKSELKTHILALLSATSNKANLANSLSGHGLLDLYYNNYVKKPCTLDYVNDRVYTIEQFKPGILDRSIKKKKN